MKRSIGLVAICLAWPLAASAQSKLTIYGIVDASVVRVKAGDKGSDWQMRDGGMNSSRIGFTGSEDLGGGLRASFVLEGQFALNSGVANTTNTTNTPAGNTVAGGLTWNRKSTISLHSPYGEVRFGRDYVTTFVPPTYFDPFQSAGVASATNFQAYYTSTLVPPTLVRASDTVAYYIPPTLLPGYYLYAQAAPSEGNGARYLGLGTGYRKGPLLVSAAIAQTRNPFGGTTTLSPATVSPDNRLDVWSAGASYKFGDFRLMGFYQSQKLGSFGTTALNTETDRKVDDWLLGFSWVFGASTVNFSYLQRNDKGLADNDPRQIGLGYNYGFSKRTTAYVTFMDMKNVANGNYNFSASGFTPPLGQGAQALQIGMNHTF